MKNKTILVTVAILVVIVGTLLLINYSGLTGNVVLNDYTTTSYAPPYNVLNDNASIFNITPETMSASSDLINISANVSIDGYVYKKGYIYNVQEDDWEVFNFIQTPVDNSYWIEDFASADLIVNASNTLRNGENYIVAYACQKLNENWQCGCQTSDEPETNNCSRWMIQLFNVSGIDEPAVITCTDNANCTVGSCVDGACVLNGTLPESPGIVDLDLDGYLELHNCEELQNMSLNLSASYELANDIDCSDTVNWNDGDGFGPVGSSSPFAGNFNGNGNVISNLYINRVNEDYVGLFGSAQSGEISNIGLHDVTIIGRDRVGSLIGECHYETLNNFYVNGNVSILGESRVAGLSYQAADSIISNGYIAGEISISNDNSDSCGIICDATDSDISNIFISGDIELSGNSVIGYDYLSLNNTYYSEINYCSLEEGESGCTAIQNNELYFYYSSNAPMSSWDGSIWQFSDVDYPALKNASDDVVVWSDICSTYGEEECTADSSCNWYDTQYGFSSNHCAASCSSMERENDCQLLSDCYWEDPMNYCVIILP